MIALMSEAARTSETSVDNYFTRQYIPEDKSELHIHQDCHLPSLEALCQKWSDAFHMNHLPNCF
jgi:hypothetical protein